MTHLSIHLLALLDFHEVLTPDTIMTHLSTHVLALLDFHEALEDPNAVLIDVRNFNECLIGRCVHWHPPTIHVYTPDF